MVTGEVRITLQVWILASSIDIYYSKRNCMLINNSINAKMPINCSNHEIKEESPSKYVVVVYNEHLKLDFDYLNRPFKSTCEMFQVELVH